MSSRMIMEIRRYEIEPGRRDEFVRFFEEEVVPEMERFGMRVLGQFVSVEEPNVFFYLRVFDDEEQRRTQSEAFYESKVWLETLKDRALGMETGWQVDVVTPTPGSQLS